MKKAIVALSVLAFLMMGQSPIMFKSADYAADALVHTGEGWFYGLYVVTDGTDAEECTVYDNTSAAGSTLVMTTPFPTSATDKKGAVGYNPPIPYSKGIYIDCAATGVANVFYVPRRNK